jgi:hypothetical protein
MKVTGSHPLARCFRGGLRVVGFWLFLGWAAGLVLRGGAAEPGDNPVSGPGGVGRGLGKADGVTQTEVAQRQLRGSSGRVAEQLTAVLEEFARNGLGGEEVQLLGAIRGVVSQLTQEDMGRIVDLLQEARTSGDGTEQRTRLMSAFTTQKSVGLKLRQVLLEYQRQQELAGIAGRLEELALRQHTAMKDTLGLAGGAAGRKREWLSENHRITLQLQVSEQQSLRDEVASVLQRLQSWKAEDDNEAAARARDALARPQSARLARTLDAILAELEGGRFLSAAGRQREARGLLRDLARVLLPPADDLEALQQAVRELEGLAARQDVTRGVTRQLPDKPAEVTAVVTQQAELVDDTDLARGRVEELDVAAAEQILTAVGRMQEARGLLETAPGELRSRRLSAATQQEMALARLDAARRLLQERIDSLEKQRAAAGDPLSNLRQVREDVAELLRQQGELKTDARNLDGHDALMRQLAPRQGDLGDRSGDTAKRAELDSAEAASLINEAAAQMRLSQRTLGQGKNNVGAQQAAMDALTKAIEAIDRQLAELEAAEKELAQLEDLLQRLIALIEEQQDLNGETARLVRGLPVRAAREQARLQARLGLTARDLEGAVPETVPQAATYLGDAATQMVLAGNELGSDRPADARPPQNDALENLLRARRELEERIAQLKEKLGQPPSDASLEELSKLIKDAQQDLNSGLAAEAMEAMSKGLQKAGQRVRPASSGRLGRMPRMIRDPLQRADQSLREAAAAAEAGLRGDAEGEAGDAQESLAAAAAALDLAMAGMGQQPGAGEGQGGQGQQPGQGEGQGRGQNPGARAGKGRGDAGNFFGAGGGDGPRRNTTGSGRFIGLPARDRAALLQSQGEGYPAEYAPMIEQYMKNLSDQVEAAPK